MSALLITAGVVLGLLVLVYLYTTRHFKYWTSRKVAGPEPTPFFGNFKEPLFQTSTPGVFLQEMYNKYAGSPYVGFFILDKPILLLRDPDVIKQFLMKDFSHFVDRYADSSMISDSLGTRGMFLSKGQRWRQLRSALSPTFTSGRMKKMFYLMLECATQLKNQLTDLAIKSPGSSTVEVKELMARTSTDVITTCAFGINSNCISNENSEFREFGRSIFIYTFRRSLESTSMWFMPWLVKLARFSFFPKESADFLHKVFWDTIEAREKSGIPRNDVIDQLIQLKNKGKIDDDEKTLSVKPKETSESVTFNFTGEDLLAQAAVFFAAGFETTSSTLSFTLYELALQPDIQTRLRQEVNEVIAKHEGKVTYEAVLDMKYLDMVISETLRKYPPLPFLDRICIKEYTIPGTDLTIEKGTPIYIPLLGLHYDPDYFPEPEKFDPERFSDEQKHSIPPCAYLPFGEGPRICIGMRFALIAAKTELASVLSHLEVVRCKDTPVPLVLNPKATLLASTGGIPLLFRQV